MTFDKFAESHLSVRSVSGREAMALCVFHEDHNASMQFNLDTGLWVCFSCGAGGSIRKLEAKFGLSHGHHEVGLDIIYEKLNALRESAGKDTGPKLMMESQLSQYNIRTPLWKKRGLLPSTVEAFDLGYDVARNALTIPVRTMNGQLLGLIRRMCDEDADPRYRYPKGFHKNENLFASWMIANDPTATRVALTEGAVDAMTVWQWGHPCGAVLGSHVSLEQIRVLRRLGIIELVLFFDNDNAGRDLVRRCKGYKKNIVKNRVVWKRDHDLDLRKYFNVKVVDWRGISKSQAKDANDLERGGYRSTGVSMLANASPLT